MIPFIACRRHFGEALARHREVGAEMYQLRTAGYVSRARRPAVGTRIFLPATGIAYQPVVVEPWADGELRTGRAADAEIVRDGMDQSFDIGCGPPADWADALDDGTGIDGLDRARIRIWGRGAEAFHARQHVDDPVGSFEAYL